MKKVLFLFLSVVLHFALNAQNPDNEAQIGITDFELVGGTWSYRVDNNGSITGFHDKTTWNSSSYLQGHLRQISTGNFRMNYRYLEPGGYNSNYDPGYPLIVMLHGAVERGNCWQTTSNQQCYYAGESYDPANPVSGDFSQPFNNRNNLLNNDHQLLNGGTAHLEARNLAGTKTPDDPTLDPRAWPGFVLFPQMLNGWDTYNDSNPNAYKNDIYDMIRIVRLMIENFNIDPDRVYIHGLSNGGRGVLEAVRLADWLFAAAAPMSAINTPSLTPYRDDQDTWSVPLWWFQGGNDGNPLPSYTEAKIAELRTRGADVRYTKYPKLGHGVWNTAYKEPDFWSWFLGKKKSDLFVAYGLNRVCATSAAPQPFPIPSATGARLAMPREMYQYQWKRDNVLLGETTYQIRVFQEGSYQGRFSRVPNPTEADWNEWSEPVQITISAPPEPTLTNTQSIMLTDLNNANTSQFIAPPGYFTYRWWMTANNQGSLTNMPMLSSAVYNQSTLTLALPPSPTRTSYNYRTRVQDIDGCYTNSQSRTVWFSDGVATDHNVAVGQNAGVMNFTASLNGPVDVLLKWNDVGGWESNYEIWRATDANKNGNWSLIHIANANTINYYDVGLQPGTTYHYKIRAISQTATSDFVPGHKDKNITLSITTTSDAGAPTTPQDVQVQLFDTDIEERKVSVKLDWSPSTDDYAVKEYRITYGSTHVFTGIDTTSITISGLDINTNYAFTIRALDNSGHLSGPSQQVNINTKIDGLFYIHNTFFYTDLSQVEEEKWYDREFSGRVPNLTLDVATQDSYYLVNFYGYLYITTPGEYKFRVTNNDGVRLKVNDQVIIYANEYVESGCELTNMNQLDGGGNPITSINLPAGYVPVEIRYWQSEDDRCLTWEWQGVDAGLLTEWFPVPDERLTTEFIYVPPVLPAAVSDLSIQEPYGIDELTLNWSYIGPIDPPVSFEVYRATSGSGPWTLVNLSDGSPYTDQNLIPLTTYFYKLKSVSANGTSGDSNIASAQTADDVTPPTAPSNVTVPSTTLTSALVEWTESFDEVGVVGYRIYVIPPSEPAYLATTTNETFGLVTNLDPATTYDIYVTAIDAKGNESPSSNVAMATTEGASAYFYKTNNGALNSFGSWTASPTGIGTNAPNTSFATDGNYFNLFNSTATPVPPVFTSVWTVSGPAARIVVGDGVTVTTSGTSSGIVGNLEILGTGKIVLSTNTQPTIIAVSAASTVGYSMQSPNPNTTTVVQQVQKVIYGNLELTGAGSMKVFQAGTTEIRGNLIVGDKVGISGASGNGSTIILHGDLIFSNGASPLFTAADNAVILDIRKPTSQQITFGGQLNLHQLKVSVPTAISIENTNSAAILTLGSSAGGGLSLPAGSTLKLSDNQTLRISGAGTLNGNSETGQIIADGGSIEITSTNTSQMNLYIDQTAPARELSRLSFDAPGGQLRVWNPVNILQGLKATAGTFHSGGNITLKSDNVSTANLEEMGEFGQVTGNVNVERFVQGKQNTYRYISASVAGVKIIDWQAFFPISGNFAGSTLTSSPSLYVQGINPNKGIVEWRGYPQTSPIKSNQAPIQQGVGYAAYIRNVDDFTISVSGVPFQGPVNFNTLIAPFTNGSYTFDGWNLLGNPYASTIQWSLSTDAWSNKNNISNIVAVRDNADPANGQFLYFDALSGLGTSTGDDTGAGGTLEGGRIAPGQAFYVQTTGPNPSLTINESAKYVGQQSFFRNSGENETSHLKITLMSGSAMDQAILALTSFATDEFEPVYDAAKLKNAGTFNFSSVTKDGVAVAINNMSSEFCEKATWLKIDDAPAGEYTIEFEDVSALFGVSSLRLVDHYLSKTIELGPGTSYAFEINEEISSSGSQRFEITFDRPDISNQAEAVVAGDCAIPGAVKVSNTQKGAWYSLFDVDGNEVVSRRTSTGSDLDFVIVPSRLKEGINEFVVHTGFEGCGSITIPQSVKVEYYMPAIVEISDASTCLGSEGSVSVLTTSKSVVSFNWYSSDNIRIKAFSGSTMETAPIFEETAYSVAAVSKNGCEGPRRGFVVSPVDVAEPVLFFENDTLFTTVDGVEYEWLFNGAVISGADKNYITGLAPGEYAVVCKNGGCDRTSKIFAVTSNEEDLNIALQYELYPNPAPAGDINLRVVTPHKQDVTVKVIDVLGREHYMNTFNPEELRNAVRINPKNELRGGVYYMILKQESRMKEIKFIVSE